MSFLDDIIAYGASSLPEHPEATSYLQDRGVTDSQIRDFDLGYIPEEDSLSFDKSSYDRKKYARWSNGGDILQGKITLPVRDPVGDVVGIHIRSPSHEKKDYTKFYLHRSKSHARFFGVREAMSKIWDTQEVFICEGLFDLFPLQRIKANTVCTLTAKVSDNQMKFLKRFADTVYYAFDRDEQGDRYFHRLLREHKYDFDKISRLKFNGKDLSESWSKLGEQKFSEVIESQLPDLPF